MNRNSALKSAENAIFKGAPCRGCVNLFSTKCVICPGVFKPLHATVCAWINLPHIPFLSSLAGY